MTDKERLGKARKLVSDYAEYHKSDSIILTDYGIELIEWLIEQSEKVEELELEVNDWRDEAIKWNIRFRESEESHLETKELLKSIVNQNKRYREALKNIYELAEYDEYDNTLEQIVSEIEKSIGG